MLNQSKWEIRFFLKFVFICLSIFFFFFFFLKKFENIDPDMSEVETLVNKRYICHVTFLKDSLHQ